ncbi:unnamed protein product, partial [Scytosiphon promiscuus]
TLGHCRIIVAFVTEGGGTLQLAAGPTCLREERSGPGIRTPPPSLQGSRSGGSCCGSRFVVHFCFIVVYIEGGPSWGGGGQEVCGGGSFDSSRGLECAWSMWCALIGNSTFWLAWWFGLYHYVYGYKYA